MPANTDSPVAGETFTPGPGQLALIDTPSVGRLGGYAAKICFVQQAKDNMPITYPPHLKEPHSEFTLDIMENGNVFEDLVGRLLAQVSARLEQVRIIEEVRGPNGERTVEAKTAKEADTFAAVMDPTVKVIFNARIASHFEKLLAEHRGEDVPELDSTRVSEPDMLVKVEIGGVELLAPVDIKDHGTTEGDTVSTKSFGLSTLSDPTDIQHDGIELSGSLRKGDWMQLAHYRRHLEAIGLVDVDAPNWGAVIGRELVLVWAQLDIKRWFKLDEFGVRRKKSAMDLYDTGFATARDVIANARARDVNSTIPALVEPEWKGDCAACQWRTVCRQELVEFGEGGHVTLLPGITPTGGGAAQSAAELAKVDVEDVKSLARLDPTQPVAGLNNPAKAVYQARTHLAGKVFRAPGIDMVDMPRAAIEIDFDLENSGNRWKIDTDPVTGEVTYELEDQLLYMFSIRATGRRKLAEGRYRERLEEITYDDYTNTPEGELKVFTQTWAYFQKMLTKARANHYSIRFYHYTAHERTWLRNLAVKHAGKPGVPTLAEVVEFLDSGYVVDMYPILAKQLVWPTKSHSIKDLAKHIGYTWNVTGQIGGDQSIAWHKAACSDPDLKARAASVDKLRRYGQSDVEAQTVLRSWVTQLDQDRPGGTLASVTSLKAPLALPRRSKRSA